MSKGKQPVDEFGDLSKSLRDFLDSLQRSADGKAIAVPAAGEIITLLATMSANRLQLADQLGMVRKIIDDRQHAFDEYRAAFLRDLEPLMQHANDAQTQREAIDRGEAELIAILQNHLKMLGN